MDGASLTDASPPSQHEAGKDHELSGCDILEQRTLDFAQLIQNTRDPVEAEELRFKSALCLFLSQRDTEELKTVVAAALKEEKGEWPEGVKVRADLAALVSESYSESLSLQADCRKDAAALFHILWSEWLRLASALHEADKAQAQRAHRHFAEHAVKNRRVANGASGANGEGIGGGAGGAINSWWNSSHMPHAASFSHAHADQSLGWLPSHNKLEAKENKPTVKDERSSAHILGLHLTAEVRGNMDTDANGQATLGAREQTGMDDEDAEQEDADEAQQRAADIAEIAHVVSDIALADEAHHARQMPRSPSDALPGAAPTSPSLALRTHEASVAPHAAPNRGRESTPARHGRRQGTVQSLQCHKVDMRLQLNSLHPPRLSAAPHARLGSLSERLLRPGPGEGRTGEDGNYTNRPGSITQRLRLRVPAPQPQPAHLVDRAQGEQGQEGAQGAQGRCREAMAGKVAALKCKLLPDFARGRGRIKHLSMSVHSGAASKGLPARDVMKHALKRAPLGLDSADAGGAKAAKGQWDVLSGQWRAGNERLGRQWRALRALALSSKCFLSIVATGAAPVSPSSPMPDASWPSPLLQASGRAHMPSRAPSIHSCAMMVGRARNRPLHQWMEELEDAEDGMWRSVMACALGFDSVRPERLLPLLPAVTSAPASTSHCLHSRLKPRRALWHARATAVACNAPRPRSVGGVDVAAAPHLLPDSRQSARQQAPEEAVVVWKFDAIESLSSLTAKGTRAQPPQQEAGEHAAESRPATNSASGAKRRRRRRRHASRDESDDDDDHHRDQDHVSLAALPGLPTPVDRLGEEQSATPPPLPAAPAEPHAPLLFLGKKPMSERRLVVGSLAWRQKMAKSSVLTSFQSQMGFDVRRIFEGWKVLMRSRVALATVMDVQNGYAGNTSRVSMRELDRAVRVLHKKLAMIFKNAAEAFIFFDPDASYTISFAELKRGIFRLNLQEMWTCSQETCVKYCCPVDLGWGTSKGEHQYIYWNDCMISAAMRLLDFNCKDGVLDFKEWADMMDWSVVNVPIQQRASMRGSVFVRSQQEMFDDKARSESEYAAAWLRHKQIIDHGRHWGMLEDWRKVTRARGGHGAWRELEAILAKLCELRQARAQAHADAAQSLSSNARSAEEASMAVKTTGKVWNTRTFQSREAALEQVHAAVKAQELVMLRFMEQSAVHLALKDALLELRPGAALIDLDDEVENVNEVLESFLVVLVTLSAQERTMLLLAPRLPQFRNHTVDPAQTLQH